MSDELRWLRETCEAGDEEARLRAEVEAWMDAEGRAGRLRQNRHAPMWREYEAAVEAHGRVSRSLNSVWPELLAVVEAADTARAKTRAIAGDEHGAQQLARESSALLSDALVALDAAIRRSLDGAR